MCVPGRTSSRVFSTLLYGGFSLSAKYSRVSEPWEVKFIVMWA